MAGANVEPDGGIRQDRPLRELLRAGTEWLQRRGIDEPGLKLEWLAASVFGRPRAALPLDSPPEGRAIAALRAGLLRLGEGEPVQYVVGDWDFRSLTLRCDARALIPRPETEQLVGLVLDEARLWRNGARPHICDVGTGTGAIALSLASERPQCSVAAVDCEEAALSLARENCDLLGLGARASFALGRNCAGAAPASFDAVVSNPPYVKSAMVDSLPSSIRDFEPRSALDGGADGLDVLRGLVPDAAISLKRGGFIFLEIGEDQGADVAALLEDGGFSEVAILKDFNGFDRFAKGRID